MAGGANHQGLASPIGHGLGPQGLEWSGSGEVGELTDVVNFHVVLLLTDLASILEEPSHDFLVRIVDPNRLAVDDRRRFLPMEWCFPEPCDQWLPAVAFDACFEAGAQPARCLDFGFMLGRHLRHCRVVLACQGLEHGSLHDPAQPVKPVDVSGQQVVLDDAPIDGPERGDDGVVAAVGEGLLFGGFAAVQVGDCFGLDHVSGDTESDLAVHVSATTGLLRVVVLDGDLIAEESSRAGPGVGDQRLIWGEFQFEVVTQELRQPLFDFLGFGLRSGEPEQMVICEAYSRPVWMIFDVGVSQ